MVVIDQQHMCKTHVDVSQTAMKASMNNYELQNTLERNLRTK